MKLKRQIILIAAFFSCTLPFQNCSRVSPEILFSNDSSSKVSNSESEGGAQPYDGKIFVLLGDVCPDQSTVHAKIVLKGETSASLLREKCQDMAMPLDLTAKDFQWTSSEPNKLTYENELFNIIGTNIDMSLVTHEIGYCYWMKYDFGTPSDSPDIYVSRLQLYEDGRPLGPAHQKHDLIRNTGLGMFSHWLGYLRFTASDNSDPLTNGRTYTYEILDHVAP